jgi:histidinol-phosphate aminotransferase
VSADARVRRIIRRDVLDSAAYHVPESAGMLKLDAMENPYAWPEDLRDEWLHVLRGLEVNRYPDADAGDLKNALRTAFAVPDGVDLLVGNGSDEIIQIMMLAMAGAGRTVVVPEPSFVMYRVTAGFAGLECIGVPLTAPDFGLDLERMLAEIERHEPAAVFLAWPNNPTGNLFERGDVERIIQAAPGIVVVDEAYHAFAGRTFMPLLRKYEHLLLLRTLSKIGMAGLRLGFLAGHPRWLSEFDKLRLPYNISMLTQASVRFFLEHIDVLDEQAARIRESRQALFDGLQRIAGIRVWPSAANFILIRTERLPAAEVHGRLKSHGVLVKNVSGTHPLLDDCLRITVGTPDENQAFLEALEEVVKDR